MDQQRPPGPPPPPPPSRGVPPHPAPQPPPTSERPRLPAWQVGLWIAFFAGIVFLARPDGELSAYQIGRWAGGVFLPILLGALIWRFAGRRGGRKADMRSPALVAIAFPIALLAALAEFSGDDSRTGSGNGAPTKAELAERFVPVPELAYARLPAEAEAQIQNAILNVVEFAETYEIRILVGADGRERARVVALGFDVDAMSAEGTNEFLAGVADGMESSSGSPTKEVSVDGVDAVLGEAQGTSILMLPDTEDGTVLFVYAPEDSKALDVGEHLIATF